MLRGKIVFDIIELDDLILQRTDGSPTYNFVVVVDDADMGITHVVRVEMTIFPTRLGNVCCMTPLKFPSSSDSLIFP